VKSTVKESWKEKSPPGSAGWVKSEKNMKSIVKRIMKNKKKNNCLLYKYSATYIFKQAEKRIRNEKKSLRHWTYTEPIWFVYVRGGTTKCKDIDSKSSDLIMIKRKNRLNSSLLQKCEMNCDKRWNNNRTAR